MRGPGGLRTRGVLAGVVLGAVLAGCTSGPAALSPGKTSVTLATIPFTPGSPWSGSLVPVVPPKPVNTVTAVTCVTAAKCWAVGSTVGSGGAPNGAALIATSNGGSGWTAQPIPPTTGYLADIACSTPSLCVAVGQGQGNQGIAISTTNGGTSWGQAAVPAAIGDVTTVTCGSDRRCLAIGSVGSGDVALVSTSAGATWTQAGTLSGGIGGASGVSCLDAQHCWVSGHTTTAGSVVSTANGGSSWTSLPIPAGSGLLNSVSCVQGPTDQAGAVPGSAPGGQITVPTSPTSAAPSTSTSLAAGVPGVRCVVAGSTANVQNVARTGHGVLFTSSNGGATWTSQPTPASVAAFFGVSCIADDTCVAVGSTVTSAPTSGLLLFTGATAKAWKAATTVTSPEPLLAVTCSAVSQCLSVGESIIQRLVGS
ncbi:MAG TPA: hypothetical protein VG412_10285 [Acidimicrobiales bacterium]|nr:hypothetical protein [Acidimicrobiales bacterium]